MVAQTQTTMASGIFFDLRTFEPLFNSPGWEYALSIWARIYATRGPEVSYNQLFKQGRCAFVIHYTGGLKWSTKSGVVKRPDANGNTLWIPQVASGKYCYPAGTPQMPVSSWAPTEPRSMVQNVGLYNGSHHVPTEYCTPRTSTFPGSTKVVDWRTGTPVLSICDLELCPHADERGINKVAFWPEGGWSWSLSARATAAQKTMLWAFFAYHYSPPISRQWATLRPQMDQHRYSHISPPSEVQATYAKYGFSPVAYHDFITVAQESFSSLNSAFDLQVPGYDEYWSSMNTIMANTYGACHFVDTDCRTIASVQSLNAQVQRDATREWNSISARYGKLAQVNIYRESLGIRVALSRADQCKYYQGEATDCPDGNTTLILIIVASVLGGLGVVAGLVGLIYWMMRTLQRKQELEAETAALITSQVSKAIDTVQELQAPLALMNASEFVKQDGLQKHETLREKGLLIFVDTVHGFTRLCSKEQITIFFSHQWTANSAPDPTKRQFVAMCSAVHAIASKEGRSVDDMYVWTDITSIPQACRPVQTLAIHSLPIYASMLSYFVAVCPEVMHHDSGKICNRESYLRRCWCRAEIMSFWARRGSSKMFFAETEGGSLTPMVPSGQDVPREFVDAVSVFDGDLTCCRLGHEKGTVCCDREHLLYGRQPPDPHPHPHVHPHPRPRPHPHPQVWAEEPPIARRGQPRLLVEEAEGEEAEESDDDGETESGDSSSTKQEASHPSEEAPTATMLPSTSDIPHASMEAASAASGTDANMGDRPPQEHAHVHIPPLTSHLSPLTSHFSLLTSHFSLPSSHSSPLSLLTYYFSFYHSS